MIYVHNATDLTHPVVGIDKSPNQTVIFHIMVHKGQHSLHHPLSHVAAIIPARGGSKGVPHKNIRNLGGRPLIAHSIEAALKCPLINRVIVSTDSETIADVAQQYGAEIPFLRPAELAQDDSFIGDTISHTLDELRKYNYRPAVIVVLYPTHPFRPSGLLDTLVQKNLDGHTLVTTARKITQRPQWNNELTFMTPPPGSLFRSYGLYEGHTLAGSRREPYCHIIDNPAHLHDIDTKDDFIVAEEILKRGLFPSHGEE